MAAAGQFTQPDLMRRLEELEFPYAVEELRRSLLRLELAFIFHHKDGQYGYQVPLFRHLRRQEEPDEQLRREVDEAKKI